MGLTALLVGLGTTAHWTLPKPIEHVHTLSSPDARHAGSVADRARRAKSGSSSVLGPRRLLVWLPGSSSRERGDDSSHVGLRVDTHGVAPSVLLCWLCDDVQFM